MNDSHWRRSVLVGLVLMAVVSATESLPTGAVTKASHPSAPRTVHAVKGNA
jgi:hypothetical protein